MAVAFPSSPSVGTTVTDSATGAVWRWDGTKWMAAGGGGGAVVDPNPPAAPNDGDLWFNIDEGRLYVWSNGAWIPVAQAPTRKLLVGDSTDFYVNGSTGNNANDGTSASQAWRDIQYGVNWIATHVDFNMKNAVLNVADGTYAGFDVVGAWPGLYAPGQFIIQGNVATPTNVVINGNDNPNNVGPCVYVYDGAMTYLRGMSFTSTSASAGGVATAIIAGFNGIVYISNVDFGPCINTHLQTWSGGTVAIIGDYSISGDANNHMYISQGRVFIGLDPTPITITLNGARNFMIFVHLTVQSSFIGSAFGMIGNFVGSATGQRFLVDQLSLIGTYGRGLDYFPGSTPGVADPITFGVYIP